MRSHRPLAAALLFAALLVAGCTDDTPSARPSSTPSTSDAPSASASISHSGSPSPTAGAAQTDPGYVESAIFMTPSRAHGCLLIRQTPTKATVSCQGSWSFERPPPPPGGCGGTGDWGGYLDLEDSPQFSCASDTFLGDHPTLAYGKSLRVANILCTSAQTGVTCRNTANARGFFVSRTRYSFSPPAASGQPDLADVSAHAQSAGFATPSRNIACVLSGTPGGPDTLVSCKITSFTYTPPAKPADCEGGPWGNIVVLGQEPYFQCGTGEEIRTAVYPVLPYGRSVTLGSVTCTSEPTGVVCADTSDGRRMMLSKERYSLS